MMLEGMQPRGLLPIPPGLKANIEVGKPEFKVGDKVKVIGPAWTQGYSNIIGKKGTITEVDTSETSVPYKVTFQSEVHLWFVGESLKLLPPEPKPEARTISSNSTRYISINVDDIKGSNELLRPYGVHMQRTGISLRRREK